MKALRTSLLAAALFSLGACKTVGPDYQLPATAAINRPAAKQRFIDTTPARGIRTDAVAPDAWWKLYHDRVLNQLIRRALRSNTQLRMVTANLAQAGDLYNEAQNAGGLGVGARASVSRAQISAESLLQTEQLPVFNLAEAAISASYEFDLFGKLKRATEEARANQQATQDALDLARINVVAQVAHGYIESCHAGHELNIARHSVALQQRSMSVAQRLFDAGRGTRIDVTQAKAQVDLLRADIPPLIARKLAAGYGLAVLLGDTPSQLPASVSSCTRAPTLSQPIPVGNGMTLLQRRPDVRQAERKLAAATARIGVATAELYPDVTLGGSIGATGLLADFGTAPTQSWSLGPLISWTFPTHSARARIRATEAGADAALAAFDQTVLVALRDAQTALSNYAQALDRQRALHEAVDGARTAAGENGTLYRGGRSPYLTSLDAQRTLATAQAEAAATNAQVSVDQINLFLALGGGWQSASKVPVKTVKAARSGHDGSLAN